MTAALRTAREVLARQLVASEVRRRKVPRQRWPREVERRYERALTRVVAHARAAYAPLIDALPQLLPDTTGDRDDAGEGDRAVALMTQAYAAFEQAIEQEDVASLARRAAAEVSIHNREQLGRQVRAALGVDIATTDRALAAMVDDFVAYNVSLIKRIPARLHGEVQSLMLEAITSGRLTAAGGNRRAPLRDGLAKDVAERFGVHERHARVIARDQVGKLYSQVNEARQRELGLSRFKWRSSRDQRVRSAHRELDRRSEAGEVFSYDRPPREGIPGRPYQCRCHAEPVFDDVLAEIDALIAAAGPSGRK